jgi:hypothetical protein
VNLNGELDAFNVVSTSSWGAECNDPVNILCTEAPPPFQCNLTYTPEQYIIVNDYFVFGDEYLPYICDKGNLKKINLVSSNWDGIELSSSPIQEYADRDQETTCTMLPEAYQTAQPICQ